MADGLRRAHHPPRRGEPVPPAHAAAPMGDVQGGVLEAARAARPLASLWTGVPASLRALPGRGRDGLRRARERRRPDGRPPGRARVDREPRLVRRLPAARGLELPELEPELHSDSAPLLSSELRRAQEALDSGRPGHFRELGSQRLRSAVRGQPESGQLLVRPGRHRAGDREPRCGGGVRDGRRAEGLDGGPGRALGAAGVLLYTERRDDPPGRRHRSRSRSGRPGGPSPYREAGRGAVESRSGSGRSRRKSASG